jgi:AbrB family looped-hinge helix DNA binding protein
MTNLSTTRMSSKGQVVIPEDIRDRLKLKTGSRFVVVVKNDVIILKTIAPPTMADFDELVTEARKQAQKAGLRPGDISDAIKRARRRK